VFASLVMAGVLYTLRETIEPTRVYQILGITTIGGIFYLALLAVIDTDTRMLVKSILKEIRLKARVMEQQKPARTS